MTAAEQQSEELEVLRSIFDGDHAFSITPENAVHYLFGADGEARSFLLEIKWPPSYPDDSIPEFNLDVFYNKHLNPETKKAIVTCLTEESETLRGAPMTYSLIELIKDRFDQLMEKQATQTVSADKDQSEESDSDDDQDASNRKSKQKTEKLTKAQKRKQWDRGQANEERPRGWNWVDVVKHLSQTGHQ